MADDRGLGSPNMSVSKKREIQSEEGKMPHKGDRSKQTEQYNSDLRGFTKMKDEDQSEEMEEMAEKEGETTPGTETSLDEDDAWIE